ncbi:MAG: trehalose-6-phosphate synthase [Phycisphaerales bacterium]|nr:MAG: trehalose-6-phosphate synthase [Phycisphaerales bacterium]
MRMASSGKSELVVLANRLPVRKVDTGPSGDQWATSPGGLVSALAPILRERGGSWVGWPGDTGEAPKPFTHDGIRNVPVGLTSGELEAFYYGFCNRTIWPLFHDAVRPPEFHRRWWWPYVEMNSRFASAAAKRLSEDGTAWVHDYQLMLAPQMIRMKKPGARIGFFLHIPWPPEELFAQIPWRRQIVEGLLAADVVGFQTKLAAINFARAARRLTEATGSDSELRYRGRKVLVRAFPISIDTERYEQLAESETVLERVLSLREMLGPERRVILGVDRLDYTKGIDVRLRSFEELLSRGTVSASNTVFVQVAVPSREQVDEYTHERESIERVVGRINGAFTEPGRVPVHYLYRSLPVEELVAYYLLADVLMVTPYRDGMNLVAKEYVASRRDGSGVLVLSEFAGAANELRGSLLVNPHDIDGMAQALEAALHLPKAEVGKRMSALRRVVRRHSVFNWADAFLKAVAA